MTFLTDGSEVMKKYLVGNCMYTKMNKWRITKEDDSFEKYKHVDNSCLKMVGCCLKKNFWVL